MAKGQLSTVIRQIRKLAGGETAEEVPDRFLLQRFVLSRDENAFTELVQRHGQLVLDVCRNLLRHEQDAEDAFQAAFLVLAKKAGSIRNQDSLAAWLYGVAYRIAMNAKSRATSWRLPTKRRQTMPAPEPPSEASLHEVQTVLHEEVSRLPEKLRAPFVLCCLEGRSRAEAAQLLRWKDGTLSGRLAQARERLQKRLTRRGIALSAALGAAALSSNAASAAVPAPLVNVTVQAALLFTTGKAGAVSAQALSLAEGAMKTMALSKVKTSLALVLAASLLAAGVGLGAYQAFPAKPEPSSDPAAQPAAKAESPPKPAQEKQARADLYGDPLPPGAIARLGTIRLRHGSGRPSIAFQPDSKTLLSTYRRTVGMLDIATGKLRPLFPESKYGIHHMALSPDGKTLATSLGATIRLLQMPSGKELHQLKVGQGETNAVNAVAFSPDGKTLASGGGEWEKSAELKLWNVAEGKEIRTLEGHSSDILAVAFSPHGKALASGSRDQTVRLWDVGTGKELRQFGGGEREVDAIAFSPDGKILAAHREDLHQRLHLWEVATGKELPQFKGKILSGQSLLFTGDGKTLIVGGYEKIHLLDVASGNELGQFGREHQSWIDAIALSADGKLLAAAACDNTLSLWDTATWNDFYRFKGHQGHVGSVAYSPDGKLIATADWGTVRIWDPVTGNLAREFQVKTQAWFGSLAFSPDGKLLAYGSCNGPRHLWEVGTWNQLLQGDDPESRAARLAFSPDGTMLACVEAYGDLSVRLWSVATGKLVRQCVGHEDRVYAVAFSPDGGTVLSGSHDKTIRLWKASTGDEIRQFIGHEQGIDCMALSPDGKTVASGSWNEPIRLWEVATGKQRLQLGEHLTARCLAFSPDGRTLASGSAYNDSTIHLWDVSTGTQLGELKGHDDRLTAITFSPDGKSLASGSSDSTALVWDVSRYRKEKAAAIVKLKPQDMDGLWNQLASADSREAFQAIGQLTAAPEQAAAFLKGHLQPARLNDSPRIRRLLADLESDQFAVRDKAAQELEKMGDSAEVSVRHVLNTQPPLDLRRRLEGLVFKFERRIPLPQDLRGLRAIEVLEHINTAEARDVLQTLAAGVPEARLTQEAKAALSRLTTAMAK